MYSNIRKFNLYRVRLCRDYRNQKYVIGILMNSTATFSCVTLENYDKIIPEGEYEGELTYSLKFSNDLFYKKNGIYVPEIMNVEGRSGIRIHVGNFVKDTTGCILLGESVTTNGISNSKHTYERFMSLWLPHERKTGEIGRFTLSVKEFKDNNNFDYFG